MDELDYWRLCDELNVVQAALLVVGEAPNLAEFTEVWDIDKRPKGYEAAKTAIANALRNYKRYRDQREEDDRMLAYATHESIEYVPDHQHLDLLLSRSIEGKLIPLYETDINGNQAWPIEGSIDLYKSTVEVDSLKQWLKSRGFTSGFFFPEGSDDSPDYLDPANPRYAPKLAAAVRAWQAVTGPGKTSAKKALDKWLREHAAEFGLTDDDGLPINQAVEDCSKVANWNQKGGAPTTPGA